MALYKRGKTWWTDFSVNGQRYRQSLGTKDWRAAQARKKQLISQASDGKLAPSNQKFARLAFGEAANRYLDGRRLELAPASLTKERQLLVRLRQFFQATPLKNIAAEHVREYREWRSKQGVGPAIINMEVGCVRRILKRAKRWHLIVEDLEPLKEPRSIGRALALDVKLRLLKTASQKPEWETAYWAAMLALNTTMRTAELRALRWADVDLINRHATLNKSKTPAGERVIPLNQDAFETLIKLWKRAETFGPVEPSHFVFGALHPRGRFKGKHLVEMRVKVYDPTRPIGSWRTAWRTLTKRAGLPGLRFHDTRHQAVTEMLEGGVPEEVAMEIAGHVDRRMLKRYSHVRLEAKRKAVEVLSRRPSRPAPDVGKEGGYDTKNVTNPPSEGMPSPEVIETNGRPERARTADLYRVKVEPVNNLQALPLKTHHLAA